MTTQPPVTTAAVSALYSITASFQGLPRPVCRQLVEQHYVKLSVKGDITSTRQAVERRDVDNSIHLTSPLSTPLNVVSLTCLNRFNQTAGHCKWPMKTVSLSTAYIHMSMCLWVLIIRLSQRLFKISVSVVLPFSY